MRRPGNISFLLTALLFIAGVPAAAMTNGQDGTAPAVVQNEAMGFSRILPAPQTAGMGYAGRASAADGAWAAFRNLSAVPYQSGTLIAAASFQAFAPHGANSRIPALGAAWRFGLPGNARSGDLQFGLATGYMAAHCAYDDDLGLAPADRVIGGGGAVAWRDIVSLGAGIRLLQSELLPGETLQACAFDFSTTVHLKDFRMTAALDGLGKLHTVSGSHPLPTSFAIAADWTRSFDAHRLRLDVDADWYLFSGSFTASLGGEYAFRESFFLRAGYHLVASGSGAIASDEASAGASVSHPAGLPAFAALGAGCRLGRIRLDISCLVAGGSSPSLGGTVLGGISYNW